MGVRREMGWGIGEGMGGCGRCGPFRVERREEVKIKFIFRMALSLTEKYHRVIIFLN